MLMLMWRRCRREERREAAAAGQSGRSTASWSQSLYGFGFTSRRTGRPTESTVSYCGVAVVFLPPFLPFYLPALFVTLFVALFAACVNCLLLAPRPSYPLSFPCTPTPFRDGKVALVWVRMRGHWSNDSGAKKQSSTHSLRNSPAEQKTSIDKAK